MQHEHNDGNSANTENLHDTNADHQSNSIVPDHETEGNTITENAAEAHFGHNGSSSHQHTMNEEMEQLRAALASTDKSLFDEHFNQLHDIIAAMHNTTQAIENEHAAIYALLNVLKE